MLCKESCHDNSVVFLSRCRRSFSHPVGNSFPRLFDQSLVHRQHPVSLRRLQSSLHLLPPHLHLDVQALTQLKKQNWIIYIVWSLMLCYRWNNFTHTGRALFPLTSNQIFNKIRGKMSLHTAFFCLQNFRLVEKKWGYSLCCCWIWNVSLRLTECYDGCCLIPTVKRHWLS